MKKFIKMIAVGAMISTMFVFAGCRNGNGRMDYNITNNPLTNTPGIGGNDRNRDFNIGDKMPNERDNRNRDDNFNAQRPNNDDNNFNRNNGSNNRTYGRIIPTIKPVNYLNIRPDLDFVRSGEPS